MKFLAGLLVLAATLQQYVVLGEAAAAAAAAASSSNGGKAVAVAAAAASSSSSSRLNVPCQCTTAYAPVCGTDGRTYSNECILRCVSADNVAHGYRGVSVKKTGECLRSACNCPKILNQLCATDDYTYANDCYFDCENNRRKSLSIPPISVAHRGVCKRPRCPCSSVIIPVCGTDNRTYRNICILECVSLINQSQGKQAVYRQYGGACKQESCECRNIDDPLCASDKVTYKNQCVLACQNRRRDQLGLSPLFVLHKGRCSDCVCPAIYDPVCASNDVTYANVCILDCVNRRRKAQHLPPLKIKNTCACHCRCPLVKNSVCATDEITYDNICYLRCENKRRSDLGLPLIGVAHNGRCICNCSYCPRYYAPVCGSDGRSYSNRCWLDCNKGCHGKPGYPLYQVRNGPC